MRIKKIQVELTVPEYVMLPDISKMIESSIEDYVFKKENGNREDYVKLKPSLVMQTHKQVEHLVMILNEGETLSEAEMNKRKEIEEAAARLKKEYVALKSKKDKTQLDELKLKMLKPMIKTVNIYLKTGN